MIARLLLLLGLLPLLTACGGDVAYRIEGKLTNLQDSVLYVVFEGNHAKVVDTALIAKNGEFEVEQKTGDFNEATVYYNNRTKWITVFPEKDQTVKITGDATYPSMLQEIGRAHV